MKRFRKALALVLGATMMFASTMTVMAADPTTTAGAGQILDYKTITQVVPTSMKVAINPNGYKVNLRYNKVADDATFSATTKYYKYADNKYSVDTSITSENWASKKATAYIADEVQDQIITFNYGLANKSTVARNITVKLAVEADDSVKFVATEAEATNEAQANDGGAKKGEYKINLKLVPTKAATTPTTNTYEKATAYAANTQYYTRNASGVYAEATIADASAFTTALATAPLYKETTTIGTEIQASELGDISMENSTAPIAFAAGDGSTSATVAYSLPKATFALKADEYLEIGETYDNLADKFEMTALGGVAGFTIIGRMNTNTEWSQLETKTITITPTYKFADATGLETAVTTGLNQIEAAAETYTVTYNANYTGADPETKTESVAIGSAPTGTGMGFTRDGFTQDGWLDAADGDAVDLSDIDAATTVYANWVEDGPTEAYITSDGTQAWIGKTETEGFDSPVTKVITNDTEWTSSWTYHSSGDLEGWVVITWLPESGTEITLVTADGDYVVTAP